VPLIIRFSEAETVLRSVDDRPGVIAIECADVDGDPRHTFTIDTTWMPDHVAQKMVAGFREHGASGVLLDASHQPAPGTAAPVDLDDLVTACESEAELSILLSSALAAVQAAVTTYGTECRFEAIEDAARFARDVRDAVIAEVETRRR
jgi:hypothetical protein